MFISKGPGRLDNKFYVISFQLERIKLSHDHRGYGSGFFVDEVEVEVPSRNDRVTFPCHCWLAQDVDGGRTDTGMVTPQSSKPPLPSKLRVKITLSLYKDGSSMIC